MFKKPIYRMGLILMVIIMIPQVAESLEGVSYYPLENSSPYPSNRMVFKEVSMVGKIYLNNPAQLQIEGKDPSGNSISFKINGIDSNQISIANLVETCEKAAGMVMMNPKKYFFTISSSLYEQDPENTIFTLGDPGSFQCYLHRY